MRTASGEAPRSGLYATFSITTPVRVHTTIATITAAAMFPPVVNVVNSAYAPTIMMSPWAKLSIFAMP